MSITLARAERLVIADPVWRGLSRASAPVLGVAAACLALVGAGTPSYWGDEAATVMSSERPLPSLALELSHVDAVHGAYYAFMHFWVGAFGASELATRMPSVIAAGFAVAGVVLLGRALFGLEVGFVSGAALAVMPTFTRLAIEARSYELDVALAVWLTLLLVAIVHRRAAPRWMWVLYGTGMAAAIWLWVFSAMMLAVHLALLLALRAPRRVRMRWARWLGIVAIACLPIAVFAVAQRGQIAFLAARDYATLQHVLVGQWFGNPVVAALAWTLLVVAAVAAFRMPRPARRRAAALAVWAFGPTALLLAVQATIVPVYTERYLAFSMPAVALGIGLGITATARWAATRQRIRTTAITAVLVGVLAASALPTYLEQRQPTGKGGADLRQVAEILRDHASPGDAVIYDRTIKPSAQPRPIAHLYPADVAGLDDVALRTPYVERAGIWDTSLPVSALGTRLADHGVVWALEVRGSGSPDLAQLHALGYVETAAYSAHRTTVHRLMKETP